MKYFYFLFSRFAAIIRISLRVYINRLETRPDFDTCTDYRSGGGNCFVQFVSLICCVCTRNGLNTSAVAAAHRRPYNSNYFEFIFSTLFSFTEISPTRFLQFFFFFIILFKLTIRGRRRRRCHYVVIRTSRLPPSIIVASYTYRSIRHLVFDLTTGRLQLSALLCQN